MGIRRIFNAMIEMLRTAFTVPEVPTRKTQPEAMLHCAWCHHLGHHREDCPDENAE
jgi:hypothetical protein